MILHDDIGRETIPRTLRELHMFQSGASLEGMDRYGGDTDGDCYGFQMRAIRECGISDTGDMVGDRIRSGEALGTSDELGSLLVEEHTVDG